MEDDVIRVLFVAPMHVWAKELSVEEVCVIPTNIL